MLKTELIKQKNRITNDRCVAEYVILTGFMRKAIMPLVREFVRLCRKLRMQPKTFALIFKTPKTHKL